MRLKRFQQALNENNINAAVIFNSDPNFRYFNGFDGFQGVLAISESNAVLFVHRLDFKTAKMNSRIRNIAMLKENLFEPLKKMAKQCRIIGINKDNVTLNGYKRLKNAFRKSKFVDVSSILAELRSEKTDEEIRTIKRACSISDEIFGKAVGWLSCKKTELEIADLVRDEMRKRKCIEAFPTIVASNVNSANIHHKPTNRKLDGFTIIDLGVKYNGYCTDVTRTFYVGKPSKKEVMDYFDIFDAICQIKTAKDIEKMKPLKNQVHSSGHSIGVDVHEKPSLDGKKLKIRDRMVFAIEPAAYYSRYGIRIEDMVLVRNNKLINLTKYPKDLIIIRK